ncbi:MAG: hypothetical protein ACI814_000687 [Mariniblastus sp.]|jgi:hypothetical protein
MCRFGESTIYFLNTAATERPIHHIGDALAWQTIHRLATIHESMFTLVQLILLKR